MGSIVEDVGSIERELQRGAQSFTEGFIKVFIYFGVAVWPLAVVTEGAFGPHPGALGWGLGIAAEVVWLPVLAVLYAYVQHKKTAKK